MSWALLLHFPFHQRKTRFPAAPRTLRAFAHTGLLPWNILGSAPFPCSFFPRLSWLLSLLLSTPLPRRHRPHWMVVGEGLLKLQTFLSLSVPSAEDASEALSEWRKNRTGKDTPCFIRSLENRIPLSIQLSLEKFFFFFFLGAASLFPWDGLLSKITLRRSAILPILLAVKCSSAACVSPAGEIAVSQGISGHSLAKLSLTKGTHGQAIFLFFF